MEEKYLESTPVTKWNGGASTSGNFNSFRSNNDENSNPNSGGSFGSRSAGSGFGGNCMHLFCYWMKIIVFFKLVVEDKMDLRVVVVVEHFERAMMEILVVNIQ